MNRQNYVQRKLSALAPNMAASAERAKVRFYVTLAAVGGQIALEFEQEGVKGQDFIAITKDSEVEIHLRGDQLWFSKDLDAITTKEELSSFYGGLVYADYDKGLDRYKSVRFCARFNSGGKYGTIHAFNLNVDLLRGYDEQKTPKWIAITIDPDIKNPPPIPG